MNRLAPKSSQHCLHSLGIFWQTTLHVQQSLAVSPGLAHASQNRAATCVSKKTRTTLHSSEFTGGFAVPTKKGFTDDSPENSGRWKEGYAKYGDVVTCHYKSLLTSRVFCIAVSLVQRNFSQAWMQWLDIYSVDNLTPTIKLFGTKLKTSSTTRYQYFKLCCGRDPFQTHSMHQNLKRLRPQAIHWSILTCRWWRMQACWFPSFAAGSEDPLLYNQMVARIISAPKCSTL